ncbi:MAG TPA: TonB-dependent receptor [Vicinamibacterales bacterium]|nr:TonB-dependent receptor [Vicinamibacterales bacterium]
MNRIIRLIFAALLFCGAAVPLHGQVVTATLLGTVTDNTGAVVPGATVTVRNVGTDRTWSHVTEGDGRYREPLLPVGTYEIRVELAGFAPQVRRGVQLTVGSEVTINFVLSPASLQEDVIVTGEAPVVQTSSSEVGALVDQKQIQQLPLNARDVQQLAILQPGVQSQSAYNGLYGANISVRGSRPEQNRYLLNGVDAGTTFGTAPVSAANIIMGVEGLQEFSVLTSDYSAAYGTKQGGVINMITKAGTNNFRGSLYEFHRNEKFDSKNYFDQGDIPPFQRDQFGASFGGPIARGKTFFFANYEQFRQRLGLSHVGIVPDERARQGYLPDPDRPGREIFVGVAPQMQPYLALWPRGNGRVLGDGTMEYFSNPEQSIDERYFTTRVDHALTSKDNFWTVLTGDWSESLTPEESGSFGAHAARDKLIWSAQNSHVFSNNLVNSVRVGVNWNRYLDENDPLVDIDRAMYIGPDPFLTPSGHGQFPGIEVGELSGLAGSGNGPVWYDHLGINIDAEFNFTRGAHSFQFGGTWSRSMDDGSYVAEQARGETLFDTLEQFMRGRASRVNIILPGSYGESNFRSQLGSVYVEDSWRASSRLTVNLGVRWEALLQMDEANGKVSNLRGGPTDTAPTIGNPILEAEKNNFAPRFGFNWDVFGDGRTSVRGGGGVFHNQISPFSLRELTNNVPFTTQVSILNAPWPNVFDAYSPSTAPPDFGAVEFQPKTPVLYSYHLSVQRDLGKRTAVTVSYVGSQGRNLPSGTIVNNDFGNRLVPQVLDDGSYFWPTGQRRPNQNFGRIGYGQFIYESSYNALQFSVERRVAEGLAFTGNYTWSDCIDDVSGELNVAVQNTGAGTVLQYARDPKSGRGNCSFTSVHSGNITTTWDLPGRDLGGALGAVFGGWRWSTITTLQSGLPFNITTGFNRSRQNVANNALGDRPNWAASCNADSVIRGGVQQYFDPNCFELPPPGFLGNVPARVLRGPGLITSDWSFAKGFRFNGERRLEIQAQIFNIFNRANFAVPNGRNWINANTRNTQAGRITRTVTSSRQAQFGIKFLF